MSLFVVLFSTLYFATNGMLVEEKRAQMEFQPPSEVDSSIQNPGQYQPRHDFSETQQQRTQYDGSYVNPTVMPLSGMGSGNDQLIHSGKGIFENKESEVPEYKKPVGMPTVPGSFDPSKFQVPQKYQVLRSMNGDNPSSSNAMGYQLGYQGLQQPSPQTFGQSYSSSASHASSLPMTQVSPPQQSSSAHSSSATSAGRATSSDSSTINLSNYTFPVFLNSIIQLLNHFLSFFGLKLCQNSEPPSFLNN